MKKVDYNLAILSDYLNANSRITLSEASMQLNVSESTARRLFTRLEQEGKAIRIHGGIQQIPEIVQEYSFDQAEVTRLSEKKRIASVAIKEIGDATSIYLDSGSTCLQVSLALAKAIRDGEVSDKIVVFTNSLRNVAALTGSVQLNLIGGRYREYRRDFCGFLTEDALRKLNFDICIIGTDGCKPGAGLTVTEFESAKMSEIIIERSSKKILVADSSKFNTKAMLKYAPVSVVEKIYTDTGLSEDVVEYYYEQGVEIIRV